MSERAPQPGSGPEAAGLKTNEQGDPTESQATPEQQNGGGEWPQPDVAVSKFREHLGGLKNEIATAEAQVETPGFKASANDIIDARAALRAIRDENEPQIAALESDWLKFGGEAVDEARARVDAAQTRVDARNFRSDATEIIEARGELKKANAELEDAKTAWSEAARADAIAQREAEEAAKKPAEEPETPGSGDEPARRILGITRDASEIESMARVAALRQTSEATRVPETGEPSADAVQATDTVQTADMRSAVGQQLDADIKANYDSARLAEGGTGDLLTPLTGKTEKSERLRKPQAFGRKVGGLALDIFTLGARYRRRKRLARAGNDARTRGSHDLAA